MLLCFGSRRRAANQESQWDEGYLLLDDESQTIPNPYFLDTGKRTQHSKLLLSNTKLFIFTAVFCDKTRILWVCGASLFAEKEDSNSVQITK